MLCCSKKQNKGYLQSGLPALTKLFNKCAHAEGAFSERGIFKYRLSFQGFSLHTFGSRLVYKNTLTVPPLLQKERDLHAFGSDILFQWKFSPRLGNELGATSIMLAAWPGFFFYGCTGISRAPQIYSPHLLQAV